MRILNAHVAGQIDIVTVHVSFAYLLCSQGLADSTVVAKVNDVTWDLDRPFEESASLKLVKFDDPEGNKA